MDLRELKALEIAARCRITFDGTCWLVPSQQDGHKYPVLIGPEPSCSCDDFLLRQQPCKHILAARLVCAREYDGKVPATTDEAAAKKPTYKQNWPAYNEAQMTEKHRFQTLLFDLCRTVEEPPAKVGRRRTPMADRVFACAVKVYTTFSSRRFACELKEAHARGYLSKLMNSLSVNAYLEEELLTPVLGKLIVASSLPLRAVETVFAPDSSGFSTSRFVRWHDEKYGLQRSGKDWVKAHAICGVKTNIVTCVVIDGKEAADSPQFKALVGQTAENFTIKEVPADKAYLSHDNLALVDQLGGTAFVPFKSNSIAGEAGSLWEKMFLYYRLRREEVLQHYHQRSNAESTVSMVKAKFRDHIRAHSEAAMKNEVLCKFLCHNICVVHKSHIDLGIAPTFWPDTTAQLVPDHSADQLVGRPG
jgi:transposase